VESSFEFLDLEPICVERHHVGSAVLVVITIEIFFEPLKNFAGVVAVENALIQVGAVTTFVSLDVMSVEGNFPDT
jgi:hypothetical protein